MLARLAKGVVFAAGIASLGRMFASANDMLGEPATLPELPPEWVDRVLRDLASVDVERWRRFAGTVVHAGEVDGHHWELTLSRGAPYEPGSVSAWWRHDDCDDTVPELIGRLTVTTLRAREGEATGARLQVDARVELVHGRDGHNHGTLRLNALGAGARGMKVTQSRHACVVPWPRAECEHEGGAETTGAPPIGWSGFPPPLTQADAFPELPLTALDGCQLYLVSLVDLGCDPHELILGAETTEPACRPMRLRINADGALQDRYPELGDPSGWNTAEGLDLAYVIDEWSLDGDVLSFRGSEWAIELSGDGLQVRLEATG